MESMNSEFLDIYAVCYSSYFGGVEISGFYNSYELALEAAIEETWDLYACGDENENKRHSIIKVEMRVTPTNSSLSLEEREKCLERIKRATANQKWKGFGKVIKQIMEKKL